MWTVIRSKSTGNDITR